MSVLVKLHQVWLSMMIYCHVHVPQHFPIGVLAHLLSIALIKFMDHASMSLEQREDYQCHVSAMFLILPDFCSPLGNLSVTNSLRDSTQIPRTAAFFAMGFATAGRPNRCVAGKPIGDPFCRHPIASPMRKTRKMRLRFGLTRIMSGYRAHLRHYCGLKHRNCLCTTNDDWGSLKQRICLDALSWLLVDTLKVICILGILMHLVCIVPLPFHF